MLGRGGKRAQIRRKTHQALTWIHGDFGNCMHCGPPHQKEDIAELGKKLRTGTRISARFFI